MNTIGIKNLNGELINLNQACEITNLGANTIRKLAAEAGAVRKIGKSYRIKKEVLLNYIDENYTAEQQKAGKKWLKRVLSRIITPAQVKTDMRISVRYMKAW